MATGLLEKIDSDWRLGKTRLWLAEMRCENSLLQGEPVEWIHDTKQIGGNGHPNETERMEMAGEYSSPAFYRLISIFF